MRSRKHLARAERERILRNWILVGTAVSLLLIVGVLGYGWLDLNVLQLKEPVATVNGEEISTRAFRARARLIQIDLLSQQRSGQQALDLFSDNPQILQSIQQQLAQIQSQLASPVSVGQSAVDQLVDEALLRQGAAELGITVSQEEVDRAIEESFGYYRFGTPTPAPTSTPAPTGTPDATERAAAAQTTPTATPSPSSTPTEGPSPSPSPTGSPAPTATVYDEATFETNYATYIHNLEGLFDVLEADFRDRVEGTIYRQKMIAHFEETVPRDQEQVHARHILVADEATAQEVLDKLDAGEDWEALASQYSTDTNTKDSGGDLGWFPRGRMVSEFEDAAFATPVGQVSAPVQTTFGWHLIQVLGKETRPLDDASFQRSVQSAFTDWLSQRRDAGAIEIRSAWIDRVPSVPSELPPEFQ